MFQCLEICSLVKADVGIQKDRCEKLIDGVTLVPNDHWKALGIKIDIYFW